MRDQETETLNPCHTAIRLQRRDGHLRSPSAGRRVFTLWSFSETKNDNCSSSLPFLSLSQRECTAMYSSTRFPLEEQPRDVVKLNSFLFCSFESLLPFSPLYFQLPPFLGSHVLGSQTQDLTRKNILSHHLSIIPLTYLISIQHQHHVRVSLFTFSMSSLLTRQPTGYRVPPVTPPWSGHLIVLWLTVLWCSSLWHTHPRSWKDPLLTHSAYLSPTVPPFPELLWVCLLHFTFSHHFIPSA